MPTLYQQQNGRLPGYNAPVDMSRCRVQTYDSVTRNFSQCTRKAVVTVDGVGYCRPHSPEEVAKRAAKIAERVAAERRSRDRKWKRPQEYRDVLRQIANGANDTREMARAVLEKWGDYDDAR